MSEIVNRRIENFQTRLLYPFTYQAADLESAVAALGMLEWKGRKVWRDRADPPPLYLQELHDEVASHLFGTEPGCGRYLRSEDATAGAWLKKTTLVAHRSGINARISWVPGLWIELFLSPFGVGVLSLSIEVHWPEAVDESADRFRTKAFNYRVAQMRPGTTPEIVTPHPADDPKLANRISPDTPQPPKPDAELEDRLGALGGRVTLPEICAYVLSPLKGQFGLVRAQNQFSVYTVLKFGADTDFRAIAADEALGAFLTGVAQVEEASHAGTASSVVESAVLNSRHFVAASCLGLVHAVADQTPRTGEESHGFNAQRIPTVREKYFSPFLFAYLQRLALTRFREEAAKLVESNSPARKSTAKQGAFTPKFAFLRQQLLAFAVSGHTTETSTRQVANYYYALVQRGLGVQQALEALRRAVEDMALDQASRSAAEESRKQGESLEIMVSMQNKVEWIEIFIISFYATELTKAVAELHGFAHTYTANTVPLWTLGAALAAMIGLKPWKHYRTKVLTGRRILAFVAVAVLAGLWFYNGVRLQQRAIPEAPAAAPAHEEAKPAASH